MKIIGITGHAKSGKDTFFEKLAHNSDSVIVKLNFADPLKKICEIMGFSKEQLNDQSLKEQTDQFWGITPRKAMQTIGTEMFRKYFGPDVWTRIIERKIEMLKKEYEYKHGDDQQNDEIIIIGDVRFQNETSFIERIGGFLIKIERPDLDLSLPIYQHESENCIDKLTFDPKRFIVIKNDGTIDDLEKKAVEFLEKYCK